MFRSNLLPVTKIHINFHLVPRAAIQIVMKNFFTLIILDFLILLLYSKGKEVISMDKKNTTVNMSLYDYEHLKKCQNGYKDLVKEIKSIIKSTNIENNSVGIIIDKENWKNSFLAWQQMI